jgi:hypothetical protein
MSAGAGGGMTILDTATDQRVLERVATMLATSPDPADHQILTHSLVDVQFLHRLDSAHDPAFKTVRFRRVVLALGENQAADAALAQLDAAPAIHDDVDREMILLEAAARVRPLSAERAGIFRAADPETFLITSIGLLLANGSPLALAEVERSILDRPDGVDESIAGMMHKALMLARLEPPVIRMGQSLAPRLTSPVLVTGLFESFFDYQYEEWFGPMKSPPEPPPWARASDEAIVELLALADLARAQALPPPLIAAIAAAVAELRAIQASRATRP